ncbi:MAG: hypothetical protein ACFFCS_19390 [Candidatus Hodarchaeota archaeon]
MSSILFIQVLALGLIHNILLITIFFKRKRVINNDYSPLKPIGVSYAILTSFLSVSSLIVAVVFKEDIQTLIFLLIFIGFVALEITLEFILKIDFRNDWRYLVPYLALYYMSNYSAVMLVWERSMPFGILILVLFICQIVVNTWSHKKIKLRKNGKKQASETPSIIQ